MSCKAGHLSFVAVRRIAEMMGDLTVQKTQAVEGRNKVVVLLYAILCVGKPYSSISSGVTPKKCARGTQNASFICAAFPDPTFSVR